LLVDNNLMLRELEGQGAGVQFCAGGDHERLGTAMAEQINKVKSGNHGELPRRLDSSWLHSHTVNKLEKLIQESIQGNF